MCDTFCGYVYGYKFYCVYASANAYRFNDNRGAGTKIALLRYTSRRSPE